METINDNVLTPSTRKNSFDVLEEHPEPNLLRKRLLTRHSKNNNNSDNNTTSNASEDNTYNSLRVVTTPERAKSTTPIAASPNLLEHHQRQQELNKYGQVSFSDYLRLEMTGTMSNNLTHDTDGALGWQEQQLVISLLQVPYHVESLMTYGLVLATDSFLFVFTYFPLRAIWGIFLLFFKILSMSLPKACCQKKFRFSQHFSRVHVYLIIRLLTLMLAAYAIGFMDMSRAYHYIKMLSFMRLYVIFNLLDIFDKLLTALGQDIFDSLHWATQNRPRERIWSIFFISIGAAVYAILHSALTFSRMVSLNVAINTKDNALLTLLISNNFIELKSSVFKRFQPENSKFYYSRYTIKHRHLK